MPPLLRPRLVCHYCGKRSNYKQKGARKFKCENCLAVNFLDEHGEIADVPPEETASPRQYAQPVQIFKSLDDSFPQDPIFCSHCVKNQKLHTEALANYLPPPEDPLYDRYEASLPEYQKSLEERYPQVCAKCEPKVRERLHGAFYHAKSDHVRRMLDRSRARRFANRLGWRSLVVLAGAIGYFASIVGQLIWHAAGALVDPDLSQGSEPTGLLLCIQQCISEGKVPASCVYTSSHLTGMALFTGLLSIWWNPMWQHKLQGREGRLRGLQDHYKIQIMVLAMRFGLWVWLQDPTTCGILPDMQRAVHSVSLVLEIVMGIASLFIVKVDTTPLVSWREPSVALLSKAQYKAPDIPRPLLISPPSSQNGLQAPHGFSIDSLASSAKPMYSDWQVPTPPEEDTDTMDWEPSSSFVPMPIQPKYVAPPQPSPFYGNLPAAPTSRLHHPRSQTQPRSKEALGLPAGFFDKKPFKDPVPPSQPSARTAFAQPKFFPDKDREVDTGLEGIFGKVFSLQEEPPEVRLPPLPRPTSKGKGIFEVPIPFPRPGSKSSRSRIHAANLLLLAIALIAWAFTRFSELHIPNCRIIIIGTVTMVPLQRLLAGLRRPGVQLRFTSIIPLFLEVFAAVALGLHRWFYEHESGDRFDLCAVGFLCGMFLQEIYEYVSDNLVDSSMAPKEYETSRSQPMQKQQVIPLPEPPDLGPLSTPTEISTGWGISTSPSPSFAPRNRADSIDSTTSTASTAASEATSGWRTPRNLGRGVSQSPGFSLGGLALNDRGSPGPRSTQNQAYVGNTRKRAAF